VAGFGFGGTPSRACGVKTSEAEPTGLSIWLLVIRQLMRNEPMKSNRIELALLLASVAMLCYAATVSVHANPLTCDNQCAQYRYFGRDPGDGFRCVVFLVSDCKPCVFGGGCKQPTILGN